MRGLRKTLSVMIIALVAILALAGCGSKSQKDVVDALSRKMEEMTGYKADAEMTLQTGEKPLTYDIEIWHKKPNYYRVNLKNAEKDQSQMILRNKEGVYVLTPALNKSFRFQSDWPQNNSQVYLMESLVSDILNDGDRTFTANEENYVFNTKTNYQNKNLYQQEITLDKKTLIPSTVTIMDQDLQVLVELAFSNVKMNAEFKEGDFDMQRNMTGAQLEGEVPTMAASKNNEMEVLFPEYVPQGMTLENQREVASEDGEKVVLTYTGNESSFTVIQEKSQVEEATAMISMNSGVPVQLGFTIGVMNEQSISWSHEGVEYFLASNELSQEEMMAIASSMQATQTK